MEQVVLVDNRDCTLGSEEKMRAHRLGKLHRAFSIFVFNSAKELLLQRRAHIKYHSGGLWSNTCCGHPRPGETINAAATRRLREEMGFICDLQECFNFLYRAKLDHALIEHEFDHVLLGRFSGAPAPDPTEVSEFRWMSLDRLRDAVATRPNDFTYWLRAALQRNEWNSMVPRCNREPLRVTNGLVQDAAC
jgi:isopentenyl-diphosphate delta-isomerase